LKKNKNPNDIENGFSENGKAAKFYYDITSVKVHRLLQKERQLHVYE